MLGLGNYGKLIIRHQEDEKLKTHSNLIAERESHRPNLPTRD